MKSILILTHEDGYRSYNQNILNGTISNLNEALKTFGTITVLNVLHAEVTPESIIDLYYSVDLVIMAGFNPDTTKTNNIVKLLLLAGIPIIIGISTLNYNATYGYYGLGNSGYTERSVYSSTIDTAGNDIYINNYIKDIKSKNISPVYSSPLYSIPSLKIPLLYSSSSSYHIMGMLPPGWNNALGIVQKAPLIYMGFIRPFSYYNNDPLTKDGYIAIFKDVFNIIDGYEHTTYLVKGNVKVDNVPQERNLSLLNSSNNTVYNTKSNMYGDYVLTTTTRPPFKAVCYPSSMDNTNEIKVENANYYVKSKSIGSGGYINIFALTSVNKPLAIYKSALTNSDIKNTLGQLIYNYKEVANTGQYTTSFYKYHAVSLNLNMQYGETNIEMYFDYDILDKSNISFSTIMYGMNENTSKVFNLYIIYNNSNISINIQETNNSTNINLFTKTGEGTIMKGIFNFNGNKLTYTNTYTSERDSVQSFEREFTNINFNNTRLIGFSNDLNCPINDNSVIYTAKIIK